LSEAVTVLSYNNIPKPSFSTSNKRFSFYKKEKRIRVAIGAVAAVIFIIIVVVYYYLPYSLPSFLS
jgi:cell division septal protein FtsQ